MDETLNYVLFLARHLDKDDLRSAVIAVLVELEFPPDHDAFEYLTEAIIQYYQDPSQTFTKEIYPNVGRRSLSGASAIQVEKSIRYTIKTTWQNKKNDKWDGLFQDAKKQPTNGKFISRIARFLELWQHCYGEDDSGEKCEYTESAVHAGAGRNSPR